MQKVFSLVLVVLASTTTLFGEKVTWEYPLVHGYGGIVKLPHAAVQPEKNLEYKVLFQIANNFNPDHIHVGLLHVARFLNLMQASGIPKEKYKITVVVGGKATPMAMNTASYRALFGIDNPNQALVYQLKEHGVGFFACGQSLAEAQIEPQAVDSHYSVALSLIILSTTYQLKGYSTLDF